MKRNLGKVISVEVEFVIKKPPGEGWGGLTVWALLGDQPQKSHGRNSRSARSDHLGIWMEWAQLGRDTIQWNTDKRERTQDGHTARGAMFNDKQFQGTNSKEH